MKYIAMVKSSYGFNAVVCNSREEAEKTIEYWKVNLTQREQNVVSVYLAEIKEEWISQK